MSACLICAARLRDAIVVASHARFGRESRRVACAKCGLVQQDPLPSAVALEAHYRSHDYRREHGRVALSHGDRVIHPTDPRWPEAFAAMGRARYERAVKLAQDPKPGTVLDVGCGPGHVLDHYAAAGWTCHGLDPDEEEVEKAKGHTVTAGSFERYEAPCGFDLIVAHHVLEHLRDPVGALRRMRGMLNAGGKVVIEVPDLMRPVGPLSFDHFQWVHLIDLTKWTLCDAMRRSGLWCEIGDGGSSALWAVGDPCEPGEAEAGPPGQYIAGLLNGYRRWGGGD